MSVFQINLWVCEKCGESETTHEETSAWSDPVVQPPEGWDGYKDYCPACVKQDLIDNPPEPPQDIVMRITRADGTTEQR